MATDPLDLTGQAALVTGGARGIGLAIARRLARQGASVLLADLDGDLAEESAKELEAEGFSAEGTRCDVTSEEDVAGAVGLCVERFGRIDVMVNNAGVTRDATLRTMTLDDFSTVIDVHLRGAWLGTKHASLRMRESGSGVIVNISSISGKVGLPGQSNYSAAKAGIVGLTKAAAKELAHLGVRVHAVQPGLIRTPMTESMRQDIWDAKMAEIPMGRAGEPEEVANVVLFLASGLSSYLTGTVQEVTGGRYM
jgi:3-oxoacyl-[acyl-carrier protein] reductase